MSAARDKPLFTATYNCLDDFVPEPGSAYIFGESSEERSVHSSHWEGKVRDVQFVRLDAQSRESFDALVGNERLNVPLRSDSHFSGLWASISRKVVYIDFTGLTHNIWARLVASSLEHNLDVRPLYIEPVEYQYSPTPTEGAIFDLSERILGVDAMPGFASLGEISEDDGVFIPLLGFEGFRFQYVLNQVQPVGDRTIPIIGVPGFRIEYPFHAYLGNRGPLLETRTWRNARFARANCPFSLYYVLRDIAHDWPSGPIRIAPIGTKPHALGAVLFYLSTMRHVELIYDHPVRKGARTRGASRVSVYHVCSLFPDGIKRRRLP